MSNTKVAPLKETKTVFTPQMQAKAFLNDNKDFHYNFEEEFYYKIPCSSLILNDELAGGITPGAHRFIGINSGGKTSCSLDFMYHFLMEKGRRGVYFKCEGRLSPEVRARSGVKFVWTADEWEDGTCLVVETNIFETVFGFIHELTSNNPSKIKYFFVIDSVDNMIRQEDLKKPLTDAGKVAGGALITSVFLKKKGIELCKRGHVAIFISQIRDMVNTNMYVAPTPRQGKSSGGHSLEHNANIVIDFLNRSEKDRIREGAEDKDKDEDSGGDESKKPPIIGHWCKMRLIKTDNEKNDVQVRYPIKYGRTGGTSVWRELEVIQKLEYWEFIKKVTEKGAWMQFAPEIYAELKKISEDVPEKVQGKGKLRELLESNRKITDFLYEKLLKGIKVDAV